MKVRNAHSGSYRLPGGQVLAPGEVGTAPETFRTSPLLGSVFEVVEEAKTEAVVGADGQVARFMKPQRSGRGGR
jgi:hypothetical protein